MVSEEKKETNAQENTQKEKPAAEKPETAGAKEKQAASGEVKAGAEEQAPAGAAANGKGAAAGGRGQGRGRGRKPPFRRKKEADKKEDDGFIERVVNINRVSKVVKGGKNFSFSALVVCGDGNGQVGIGLGKSNEVVEAIKKGSSQSRANFVKVRTQGSTIPHEVIGRFKSSRVMLKPAGPGTGVIAGGSVRALCDAVGIKDILTKTLGSRNAVNVVKATIDGFEQLRLKRRG